MRVVMKQRADEGRTIVLRPAPYALLWQSMVFFAWGVVLGDVPLRIPVLSKTAATWTGLMSVLFLLAASWAVAYLVLRQELVVTPREIRLRREGRRRALSRASVDNMFVQRIAGAHVVRVDYSKYESLSPGSPVARIRESLDFGSGLTAEEGQAIVEAVSRIPVADDVVAARVKPPLGTVFRWMAAAAVFATSAALLVEFTFGIPSDSPWRWITDVQYTLPFIGAAVALFW